MSNIDMNVNVIIRTLECSQCLRFDSLILDMKEILERTKEGVGTYFVSHHDHARIIFFDKEGRFIEDMVSYGLLLVMLGKPIPNLSDIQNLIIVSQNKSFIEFVKKQSYRDDPVVIPEHDINLYAQTLGLFHVVTDRPTSAEIRAFLKDMNWKLIKV